MVKKVSFLVFIVFMCTFICDGQRSRHRKVDKRFSAGILAGLTMSQLDGDNYTGYDHRAVFGGLKVSTYLHEKLSFDVNFLYIQKGASIENEEIEFRASFPKDRQVHIDYVEVPLLFTLKPYGHDSKIYFESGIAISKLINSEVKENIRDFTDVYFQEIISEISSTDISAIVGVGSYFTENFSIGLRFSYGLNKIYKNPDPIFRETLYDNVPKQVFFLRSYYLSANISMNIF